MGIREPIVAGSFYPADKNDLRKRVKEYLTSKKNNNVKGAIVPHAGFKFSGKLAGEVISKIPEKKTFILLGVNHSGLGNKISFSKKDFKTPLGIVKNNYDLTNEIMDKLGDFDPGINENAHLREHSLEVLLPFLQVNQANYKNKFKIVPILLRDLSLDECKKVANLLKDYLGKEIGIIVSSDFTHYGPRFRFTPFNENIRENLYKLDNKIIENIQTKNTNQVYENSDNSTVCGIYGLTILTEIAKLKQLKVSKIDYYTSGDMTNIWDNVVGYSGLAFE